VVQAYAQQTLHKPERRVDAFLELHIEQGPLLEEQGKDIGVVTAIAAPAMIRVEFSGAGGHGGGMPMRAR
jgi:ureidoglycolate amidohydrolase